MEKQKEIEWYRNKIVTMVSQIEDLKLLNQIRTIIEIRMKKKKERG